MNIKIRVNWSREYRKLLLIVWVLVATVTFGNAQHDKIKGVQIYKTALNTTWPNLGETFVIGIYGESGVYFVLSAISRARKIGNSVVFVKKVTTPTQMLDCNIIFVTDDKIGDLSDIKKLTRDKDILLITEDAKTVQNWDINLISETGKVSYEINKKIINKNLVLSDKLLTGATKVH